MKLKQIEAVCKEAGAIHVFNGKDCQWLGSGSAAYAVYNLPQMTRELICTLFDIPTNKQSGFCFNIKDELPEGLFADVDENETPLSFIGYPFSMNKRTLQPLKSSLGLIFVDVKLLKPFSDLSEGYEMYERLDSNGQPYIAIKSGLMLIGVVMPYKVVTKEFVEQLKDMATLASMAYQNGVLI